MREKDINLLAKEIVTKCSVLNKKLTVAESCTGGMIASYITSVSGSSNIFDRGFVTYSNKAKIDLLNVKKETLKNHGAVSFEAAIEMVEGAINNSIASVAISITGVAGPAGGTKVNPVGSVYIAVIVDNKKEVQKYSFKNRGRKFIRLASVFEALNLLGKKLDVS